MSENKKQSRFCPRCFISGHQWTGTNIDDTSQPGIRTETTVWISHCRRCGESNPVWHRIEAEDTTAATADRE